MAEPADAAGEVTVSFVVPAYNERSRVPALLDELGPEVVLRHGEIIVVDDGSDDGTGAWVEEALAQRDIAGLVVRHPTNLGKGAAVRTGVLAARGAAIVMMDADLATDLDALDALLAGLHHNHVMIGSRVAKGASVEGDAPHRRLMGLAMRAVVRTLTPLEASDTQCGFKAFRAPEARLLFGLSRSSGFGQDLEVLLLADRLGLKIGEVPVHWTSVPGSKVRPVHDIVATGREVMEARSRSIDALPVRGVLVHAPIDEVRPLVRTVDMIAERPQGTMVFAGVATDDVTQLRSRLVAVFGGARVESLSTTIGAIADEVDDWFAISDT